MLIFFSLFPLVESSWFGEEMSFVYENPREFHILKRSVLNIILVHAYFCMKNSYPVCIVLIDHLSQTAIQKYPCLGAALEYVTDSIVFISKLSAVSSSNIGSRAISEVKQRQCLSIHRCTDWEYQVL